MPPPTLAKHLPPPLLVLQQRVLVFVILPPPPSQSFWCNGTRVRKQVWCSRPGKAQLWQKEKVLGGRAVGLISGISGAQRCRKVKREQHQLLIPVDEEFPVPLTVLHVACSRSNLEKTNIQLSLRGRTGCVLMCAAACLDFRAGSCWSERTWSERICSQIFSCELRQTCICSLGWQPWAWELVAWPFTAGVFVQMYSTQIAWQGLTGSTSCLGIYDIV